MKSESAELLQEVAGRLVSVEEGLAALDNHKTALHNHAIMVKGEISTAVEQHMAALRAKEKQLIRQVEVATTHQNSEVNVTQAQLLQHKGALSVTRTILDNCSSVAINQSDSEATHFSSNNNNKKLAVGCSGSGGSVSSTIATTVNCMAHQDVAGLLEHTEKLLRVPLVSVTVEESGLSSSIQNFGRVSSPPPLSHSELLPQCLEEYGDDEHHVLHKSVQPDSSIGAPIDVRRPYMLAAKKMQSINRAARKTNSGMGGSSYPIPVPAAFRREQCGAKEDLVKWLHRMKLDTSCEEVQMTACCGGNKVCSDVCIEEVCQANEVCSTFSRCLLSGQCQKSALEKAQQNSKWHQQQELCQQWCTPRKQQQQEECNNLQFAMDISFSARKRQRSESNDAVKSVIAHMTEIRNSSNSAWLIIKKDNNDLSNSISKLNLENTMDTNRFGVTDASTPVKHDSYKKMKVDHSGNNHNIKVRSAILYSPPQTSWILPTAVLEGLAIKLPVIDVSNSTERTDDENYAWILPAKEEKPSLVSLKKANCDKENHLCRASLMKSQISLNNLGSIENLKDKIDRMSNDIVKPCNMMTDIEEKESWLLQQEHCSSLRADNKLLEEVMSRKAEWLSNSSLASYSIITDSDATNNSWLLGQQF